MIGHWARSEGVGRVARTSRIMTAQFFRRKGKGVIALIGTRDQGIRLQSRGQSRHNDGRFRRAILERLERVEFERSRHQPKGAVTKDAY